MWEGLLIGSFLRRSFVRPSVRLTVKMHCAPSLVLTLRSPDQLALPPSLSSRPFEALSFFRVFRSQDPSEWNGFILNHLLPICQSIRTSKNVSSFSFVVQKFVSVSVEKTLWNLIVHSTLTNNNSKMISDSGFDSGSSPELNSEDPPMSRTHQYRKVMKPLLERKRRARFVRFNCTYYTSLKIVAQ